MPEIRILPNLGAVMVVTRHQDGHTLVLVDADQPRRCILALARTLLPQDARATLARALTH